MIIRRLGIRYAAAWLSSTMQRPKTISASSRTNNRPTSPGMVPPAQASSIRSRPKRKFIVCVCWVATWAGAPSSSLPDWIGRSRMACRSSTWAWVPRSRNSSASSTIWQTRLISRTWTWSAPWTTSPNPVTPRCSHPWSHVLRMMARIRSPITTISVRLSNSAHRASISTLPGTRDNM